MHYAKGKLKGDIREPDCDVMQRRVKRAGSMPFPVEIDFSTNMTVAPVVAGDGRHQGALW